MTPEQRSAEDAQRRQAAIAAEKAAAEKRAAEQAKADVAKRRDAQLQLGGLGAISLRDAMKDPEAFILRSAVVKQSGAACYQYRAKNSFGAILPSNAVMSSDGKIRLEERDGEAFVRLWNAECTKPGGDDIAPLLKSQGVLDSH